MANNGRPGAMRKAKKGPSGGTGGLGRKALEGKGPTPKAEERPYHKAYKNKQLAERSAAKRGGDTRDSRAAGGRNGTNVRGKVAEEVVTGRNSVVEALRAGIPAKALHVAVRIDMDDRVRESLKMAADRGLPVMETHKPELDRMTNEAVHQGLVLQIPPYDYADPMDLAQETLEAWKKATSATRRCSWRWTASPTRATSEQSSARHPRSAPTALLCRNGVPWE